MFTTKQAAPAAQEKKTSIMSKLPPHYPVLAVADLLKGKKYKPTLAEIKNLAFVPDHIFEGLYLKSLQQYAEFVQGLPATHIDNFNYHGGLLELGIKRALQTLAWYRREYPLRQTTPEKTPTRQAIWSYALFTVGLMYGIGQVVATYWVMLCNPQGHPIGRWNPMRGKMAEQGECYRYSFEKTRRDELAARSTLALAMDILPQEGIAWIATDLEIFNAWLSILLNDETHAGLFAKCVFPLEAELAQQPNIDAGLFIGDLIEQYDLDFRQGQEDLLRNKRNKESLAEKDVDNQPSVDNKHDIELEQTFMLWLRESYGRTHGAGGQLLMVTGSGLLVDFETVKRFQNAHKNLGSAQVIFNRLQQSTFSLGRAIQTKTNLQFMAQNTQQDVKFFLDPTLIMRNLKQGIQAVDLVIGNVSPFPAIASPQVQINKVLGR